MPAGFIIDSNTVDWRTLVQIADPVLRTQVLAGVSSAISVGVGFAQCASSLTKCPTFLVLLSAHLDSLCSLAIALLSSLLLHRQREGARRQGWQGCASRCRKAGFVMLIGRRKIACSRPCRGPIDTGSRSSHGHGPERELNHDPAAFDYHGGRRG